MIKVLFVCHGNICRSTMAEAMFKHMVSLRGLENEFYIDSAATSREEIGNTIYPPAVRKLREKGVPTGNHRARQITLKDYDEYDYIIGMDRYNISNMLRYYNNDPDHKIHKMMEFAGSDRDVADPWYTGDFEATYQDLKVSLAGFLETIL